MAENCSERLAEVIRGLSATNSHVILDNFLGPDGAEAVRSSMMQLLASRDSKTEANEEAKRLDAVNSDSPAGGSAAAPSSNGIGPFKLGELAGDDGYWTTKVDTAKRSDYIYWITEGELQKGCFSNSLPISAGAAGSGGTLTGLHRYFSAVTALGAAIGEWSRAQATLPFSFTADAPATAPPSLTCDRMMLAAYPTASAARFALHIDNPNSNGRVLTFTYYLNPGWDSGRWGGQLRLLPPPPPSTGDPAAAGLRHETLVDPVMDRLVVFFADARVPHEVLPTVPHPEAPLYRLAISLWFSYVSPRQVVDAFKGSFATWIAAIKRRKEAEQQARLAQAEQSAQSGNGNAA